MYIQLKEPSDVSVPTDFGLSYDNLELRTADGVTLRSYLMRQRKELGHHQAGHVGTVDSCQTDEEVCGDMHILIHNKCLFLDLFSSFRRHDPP